MHYFLQMKKFVSFILVFFCLSQSFSFSAYAQNEEGVLLSAFKKVKETVEICKDVGKKDVVYDAKILNLQYKWKLKAGEKFKVRGSILNTGTATWFGDNNICGVYFERFRIGADRLQDRQSIIWKNMVESERKKSSWIGSNRIKIKNEYVLPGDIARFEFEAVTPLKDGIFIEYFSPVVEGVSWMPDASIKLQLYVGDITDEDRNAKNFLVRSGWSRNLDLSNKNVKVDISEQKVFLRLGEEDIYNFPISSGKARTPTPIGKTKIFFKQELRISSKSPHYIMPLYSAFRSNGAYGFHSLPSLANDNGRYWTEARDHIGERRSHGCIRLLPEDMKTFWDFIDVGTSVEVGW